MTGVTITATIDDAAILAELDILVARMDRPDGFYRNVGEHMLRSTRSNFATETAPDGAKWAPLARSTVRKRGSAGPILTLKGYLRGSINYAASATGVTIGTGAVYAAIHQLGGRIERAPRQGVVRFGYDAATGEIGNRFVKKRARDQVEQDVTVGAHVIHIPARPFLGVSKRDEATILDIARQWVGEGR